MKKAKFVKILKFSLISLLGLLLTLVIAGYVILHTYINKMNLIDDSTITDTAVWNSITENTLDNVPDQESEDLIPEGTPEIINSPKEDIDNLDKAILENTMESTNASLNSKDVYNILLIGVDSREGGSSGRSDAMIILSINEKNKTIILTSLLRDIYLKIPGYKNNRINAAYAYGGPKLLMETIKENFKIEIDKYVSIDFYAFIDTVDSIDGIDLEVTDKDIPIINYYIQEINRHYGVDESTDLLTKSGSYLFNGKQTLGFVRNRYNGTDFKRTERQRDVLQKIFNKVKGLKLFETKKLLDHVLPQVTTNLSEKKIVSLLLSLPAYKNYEIEPWSIPMDGSYKFLTIDRMAVIQIDFEENLKELHKKVYGE